MKYTMKYILTFLALGFCSLNISAQYCTPQWLGLGNGIQPDTVIDLSIGTTNEPYAAVLNIKPPVVDSSQGFPLYIDYYELNGIEGLESIPATTFFSFNCNPASCHFEADIAGCILISGTPIIQGDYPIILNFIVHLIGGLVFAYNVPGYQITVNSDCELSQPEFTNSYSTNCSIGVSWTPISNVSYYTLKIKEISGSWTDNVNVGQDMSYTFAGLESSSNYKFVLRAYCPNNILSGVAIDTFSTLACPMPSGFTNTILSSTSVKIKWAAVCDAASYSIKYRPQGTSTWQVIQSLTNKKILTNLLPNTTYQYRVATTCPGGVSAYSPIQTFITPLRTEFESESAPNKLLIMPNPASDKVVVECGNLSGSHLVTVFNLMSKVEISRIIEFGGEESFILDISRLASGTYAILLSGPRDTSVAVLVKQ